MLQTPGRVRCGLRVLRGIGRLDALHRVIDSCDSIPRLGSRNGLPQVSANTNPPDTSAKGGGTRLLLLALFLGVVLAIVLVQLVGGLGDRDDDSVQLDDDLCPVDAAHIGQRAVALFDLRKPLGGHGSLPGEIVRQVTSTMDRHAELRAFSLAGDAFVSRKLIMRVCKPYENVDLVAEGAKDGSNERRDCDDLPAQMPAELRERAATFCQRRDELARRLTLLAAQAELPVADAHLAEAIEDAQIELSGAGDASLFVLSDLMQHAEWYSHVDRNPEDWDYDDFSSIRGAAPPPLSVTAPAAPNLDVTLFYLLRRGVTEHPRNAATHRQFWSRYFEGRVRKLTFEDQGPPLLDYTAVPLESRPAEDAVAERLRVEREEVQRLRREVEAEKRALDEARAEVAALEERQRELEREPPPQPQEEQAERPANAEPVQESEGEPAQAGDSVARQAEPASTRAPVPAAPAARPSEARGLGADAADSVQDQTEAAAVAPDRPPAGVPRTTAMQPPPADAGSTQPSLREAGDTQPSLVDFSDADPCAVRLRTGTANAYPGGRRVDYGSATVVVSYAIDQSGRTTDDEVRVVPAQSNADRPQFFDLFAEAAEDAVRDWEFDFTGNGDCRRSQQRMTRFRFTYR